MKPSEQIACLKRLHAIIKEIHPRTLKLLEQKRPFIVIGIHERYYPQAYMLIREQERIQGTWTADCEDEYQDAMDHWHKLQRAAAQAGGDDGDQTPATA